MEFIFVNHASIQKSAYRNTVQSPFFCKYFCKNEYICKAVVQPVNWGLGALNPKKFMKQAYDILKVADNLKVVFSIFQFLFDQFIEESEAQCMQYSEEEWIRAK